MNYPEKVHARPANGISRTVLAIIADLRYCLSQPNKEATHVHRIRVGIKRLRSWLWLVSPLLDKYSRKETDHAIRDVARRLSARRDSQVIFDCLKWLERKLDHGQEREALRVTRNHLQFGQNSGIDWPVVQALLLEKLDLIEQQSVAFDEPISVWKGLKRTYKRSFKLGEQAFSSDANYEDLHALRKWVKYLYYQLGFVQVDYPDFFVEERKDLKDLGDKLGRIHDLAMVLSRIDLLTDRDEDAESVSITKNLVESRIDRLFKQTSRLYREIFTLSPAEFKSLIRV